MNLEYRSAEKQEDSFPGETESLSVNHTLGLSWGRISKDYHAFQQTLWSQKLN